VDTPSQHRDHYELVLPRDVPPGNALVLSIASAGNTGRSITISDSAGNQWQEAETTVFVTSRYHSLRYSILENGLTEGDSVRLQYDGTYYAGELIELLEVADVSGVHKISSRSGYGSEARLQTVTSAPSVIVSSIHSFSSRTYSPGDYERVGEPLGDGDVLISEYGDFPEGVYKSGNWNGPVNSSQITLAFSKDASNSPPVASPHQGLVMNEDLKSPLTLPLSAMDPEEGTLSVSSSNIEFRAEQSSGRVDWMDGAWRYTAVVDYNGTATFEYRVHDSLGLWSDWATVSIEVSSVEDTPYAEVLRVDTPSQHRDHYELVIPRDVPPGNALVLSIASAGNTGRAIAISDSAGNQWQEAETTVFVTSRYHSLRYSILENGLAEGDSVRLQYDGTYYAGELIELFEVANVSDVHKISSRSGYGSVARLETVTSVPSVIVSSIHSFSSRTYSAGDYERVGEPLGDGDVLISEYGDFPAGVYKSGSWNGPVNSSQIALAFSKDDANSQPTAIPSSFDLAKNAILSGQLSGADLDGDELTYALAVSPLHGSVSVGSDGSFVYSPDSGYFGDDAFDFSVSDGRMESDPASVIVSVLPDPGDPEAPQMLVVAGREFSSDAQGAGGISKDVYYNADSKTWHLAWQSASEDSSHFVSTELAGDARISGGVEAFAPDGVEVEGGLRIGVTDAAFASLSYSSTGKLIVRSRSSAGDELLQSEFDWLTVPGHLRMDLRGGTVRCFVSEEGDLWRLIAEREIDALSAPRAGFFVSTPIPDEVAVGRLADLQISLPDERAFQRSYRVGDFGGLVSFSDVLDSEIDDSLAIATLGGSLDWPLEDGTLAYIETAGGFELSARLVDLREGTGGSSAGLMYRDGLGDGSPFYAIYQLSSGALGFAWREERDGAVTTSASSSESRPRFLKLALQDSILEVSHSGDGQSWVAVEDLDLSSAAPFAHPLSGIFASGFDSPVTIEALFDSVSFATVDSSVVDIDGDGMPDAHELANGFDPNDPNDAAEDHDSDSLSNLQEFQLGTDPRASDSDGDGMPDGWEVDFGLDALFADSPGDLDGDGRSNLSEYAAGSSPKDYYNGVAATIVSLSDPMGDLGPQHELTVRVLSPSGVPFANAPVEFFPVLGGHGVAAEPGEKGSKSVIVRTDAEGVARAYLKP
jgi:uncharacterized SAM-binding protein YcdF (DUF218 family)